MARIKCFPGVLIGENIIIVKSTSKCQVGISGIVVDETKNMLLLETTNGSKKLIKSSITFEICSSSKKIKGITIKKRPEERLKG